MDQRQRRALQLGLVHLQLQAHAAAIGQIAVAAQRRAARPKRVWVKAWIARRPAFGWYENLMVELEIEDPPAFTNLLRMEPAMFHEMVDRLTPLIQKQDTFFRKALCPGLRLAITLVYLSSGISCKLLGCAFRVGYTTVSQIIRQVCEAIVEEYMDEVIKTPATPEEWKQVADRFSERWQFHHCLGALDGKHIAMRKPRGGSSHWFNYKMFHSLVLLALVDGDYKFIWADVGSNGPASDAQIWNSSPLCLALEDETLGIPKADPLHYDDNLGHSPQYSQSFTCKDLG